MCVEVYGWIQGFGGRERCDISPHFPVQGTHCKGKTENDPKISLSGKTQGIWKLYKNTGNLLAQVVNSLILKVKYTSAESVLFM